MLSRGLLPTLGTQIPFPIRSQTVYHLISSLAVRRISRNDDVRNPAHDNGFDKTDVRLANYDVHPNAGANIIRFRS